MKVRLSKDQQSKILNSADVFKIMQQILLRERKISRNKEHSWIVCLDNVNKILLIELIAIGTVNKSLVEPMEVFSFALQKRAVKIILVHNHPSGETQPSKLDLELTDKLQAIGSFIHVPLIDHLIITEKTYLSFVDKGIMDKIKTESHYDLTFDKTEKLLSGIKKLEKRTIEIARKMIADKQVVETISKYTGLSKKQVKDLAHQHKKDRKA